MNVIPTTINEFFNSIGGAFAFCWIQENTSEMAFRKAKFSILKYDWQIIDIEESPIEVSRSDFIDKDIGLENYDKAQAEGLAIVYAAWSKDGKTVMGPIKLKPSYTINLSNYLSEIKRHRKNGRCLHFEAGNRCNEYINAHSIQNKGQLEQIAENGHVYGVSNNYTDIIKNKGRVSYKKIGIKTISTFLGFCKNHDNELFEPIDNFPLKPINQQVMLYGYRSLCRELFVKENSLNMIKKQLASDISNETIKSYLCALDTGLAFGLTNLQAHKNIYDRSLKNEYYDDIRFVLFTSDQKQTIAFSGLMYPDFDFTGKQLQDLSDHTSCLDLITFCSAPMVNGWGFLFAWHQSRSKVCSMFMNSLKIAINESNRCEDYLFRLVVNSENIAISPIWWEGLTEDDKVKILNRVSDSVDFLSDISSSYLTNGLEGLSSWNFKNVITNVQD